MIGFPCKRLFGLIGAPRAGKDTVADYLQQTRNFVAFAFADKIKEEYGISIEDFEAAKITGNIDELRAKLWEFSAKMKEKDPNYFIDKVMRDATGCQESVIITDVRTPEELDAFFSYGDESTIRRIYWVRKHIPWEFEDEILRESKLTRDLINEKVKGGDIQIIDNVARTAYYFHRDLDNFFFEEDIVDLSDSQPDSRNRQKWRSIISNYVSQFEFREKLGS
jgi:hypothetical protein